MGKLSWKFKRIENYRKMKLNVFTEIELMKEKEIRELCIELIENYGMTLNIEEKEEEAYQRGCQDIKDEQKDIDDMKGEIQDCMEEMAGDTGRTKEYLNGVIGLKVEIEEIIGNW